MPHPYLDQVVNQSAEEILEQRARTQREQLAIVRQRQAEDEDEWSARRVHRYADEAEAGPLTGEAGERRIAERRADHERERLAYADGEREYEAELTPIQIRVAREMDIGMRTALAISRDEPGIPFIIRNNFIANVETARRKHKEEVNHGGSD